MAAVDEKMYYVGSAPVEGVDREVRRSGSGLGLGRAAHISLYVRQ